MAPPPRLSPLPIRRLGSRSHIERVRHACLSLAESLDAQSCHLLERSLKTLPLRVGRQSENAMAVAISRTSGFGAMLSFGLANSVDPDRLLRALSFIRAALSLGGVECTVCAPAATSHAQLPAEVRRRMEIDGRSR